MCIHHGPDRTSKIDELQAFDVVLTSYALLPRDRELLRRSSWRALVLDEAQAVKNPLARAAQTARALEAGHRVALTGTPVENRLDDLWSIMHILNPGLLGTRDRLPVADGKPHRAASRRGRRGPAAAGTRPSCCAAASPTRPCCPTCRRARTRPSTAP